MLRRLTERGRALTIFFDGVATPARDGDSVAAALLAAGHAACRKSAVSDAPRGAYCLMGVCFDCLVMIDGIANRQACLTPVRDGMRVETQRGKREYGT
jgi:D-hydroxyproline dehydrogenase subunit gamma